MKKKIISFLTILAMLFVWSPVRAEPLPSDSDVIILYENDVHCNVDGYAKLKALKDEYSASAYVGVVSSGDFVQGGSLGSFSKGGYIIELMNLVGYDALTLGNHEFDYKLARLKELTDALSAPVTCANFEKKDGTDSFAPYVIKDYGDTKIAYIGVTTPYTLSTSSPDQFKDADGNYIYTFHEDDLYTTVQAAINQAKAEDPDFIIGLTHLGEDDPTDPYSVYKLVNNTDGFNVVLDGHSHTVDPGTVIYDRNGNPVTVSSTGTKFANIGKLTIKADRTIETDLLPFNAEEVIENDVATKTAEMKAEYKTLGDIKVAESTYDLIINNAEGKRIIRTTETNLGDLCSDAYRIVTGADIGLMNGGGIRAGIKAGEITYNDIFSVFPFGNEVVVLKLKGQTIADILEFSVRSYPEENGGFMHVSGLTYTMDPSVETPCLTDDKKNYVSMKEGASRRVSNIKVLNANGKYEPIDLNREYTVASQSFFLLSQGDGFTMVKEGTVVVNNGMVDVELLEKYIVEVLNGVIPEKYSRSAERVTLKTAEAEKPKPETGTKPSPGTSVF